MLCAACTAVSKVVWRYSMMSLRSCTSASVAMTISANRALASMSKILALKLSFCIGILRFVKSEEICAKIADRSESYKIGTMS